jgi:hypothetical protein
MTTKIAQMRLEQMDLLAQRRKARAVGKHLS